METFSTSTLTIRSTTSTGEKYTKGFYGWWASPPSHLRNKKSNKLARLSSSGWTFESLQLENKGIELSFSELPSSVKISRGHVIPSPLIESKPVGHQSHCFALEIFHHRLPKQLSYWISSERDEEKVITFEIPVRCNTFRIFFWF